jgi:DNA-binding ferritin-like protein
MRGITALAKHHNHQPQFPATTYQLSTSTSKTMTDAHTKSCIEECVQTEQNKLSESHHRISQDLNTLGTEFKQMLEDSKQEQDKRMQGL